MNEELERDLKQIEGLPARDLLRLSHEELERLIQQAKDIRRRASLTANWLASIKFEKSLREGGSEVFEGGADD